MFATKVIHKILMTHARKSVQKSLFKYICEIVNYSLQHPKLVQFLAYITHIKPYQFHGWLWRTNILAKYSHSDLMFARKISNWHMILQLDWFWFWWHEYQRSHTCVCILVPCELIFFAISKSDNFCTRCCQQNVVGGNISVHNNLWIRYWISSETSRRIDIWLHVMSHQWPVSGDYIIV